jgi:hypothetical protein
MSEDLVLSDDVEILPATCAHTTANGKRCKTKPVEGYPLCYSHIKNASIGEIALVRSKDLSFQDIRGSYVDNPLETLAELVSEVMVYKDFCAQEVARLHGEYRYEGRGGEQLRAEVALYERSLDRAGKLLVEWAKLNIDERLMRIEEAKAATIIEVIRRSLLSAELTDEQRKNAENTAIRELRNLERK